MSSTKDTSCCCTPATGRAGAEVVKGSSQGSENADANVSVDSPNAEKSEEPQGQTVEIAVSEIPGGQALRGTNDPMILLDEESPCRQNAIEPFRMMQTAVTNAMFAAFTKGTGYKTEAERYGWSFVFHDQLSDSSKTSQTVIGSHWWHKIEGACWRLINGPGSEADCIDDHPVVHVSWNDANAYADWVGGRLPSEAEWEHAARGGLGDVPFPWGNREPDDSDFQPCNIWQGQFPDANTGKDGFMATAPAQSFRPNGFGLYNMCGNSWEWTSGRLKIESRTPDAKRHAKNMKGTKLLKGGSFLCHKSYCFRYRIAARTGTTPDSTTAHQGFRLVF